MINKDDYSWLILLCTSNSWTRAVQAKDISSKVELSLYMHAFKRCISSLFELALYAQVNHVKAMPSGQIIYSHVPLIGLVP